MAPYKTMKQELIMKKILFLTFFLFLSSLLGYVISETSLSLSDKVKSFYSQNDEKEIESTGPPLIVNIDDLEEWEVIEPPSWRKLRRIIVIGDIFPFNLIEGENTFIKKVTVSILMIVSLLILSFWGYKLYRKRAVEKEPLKYETFPKEGKNKNSSLSNNNKKNKEIQLPSQDTHEIRKLLRNWENRLSPDRKKRNHETITEWFKRINGPIEVIPIYEKVRYGLLNCTKEEYILIRKKLQ
jgi:hypothetical protein